MSRLTHHLRATLSWCALTTALALSVQTHAFDPNEGAEIAPVPAAPSSRLPSPSALFNPVPQIAFPEGAGVRTVPSENPLAASPALPQVSMPTNVPQLNMSAPALPPVDPSVAAAAEMSASQQATGLPQQAPGANMPPITGFIAPAPVFAGDVGAAHTPVAAAPEPLAPQLTAMPAPIPAASALSDESKRILSGVRSRIDTPKAKKSSLNLERMSPEIDSMAASAGQVEKYDSLGLSIRVQRPGLDSNYELRRAYDALTSGDTETAVETYRTVLASDPKNQDGLFGLASTYHRMGDLEKARPLYGRLLEINPEHREGLSNFLALISEESPQEALAELERLEQRNPDFSPIPAQQATLLSKLGFAEQARERMLRAIELSPNNMNYKYNLAILLDRHGYREDAIALYRMLIDAALKGQKLPATVDTMQRRLNYIAAHNAAAAPHGG